MRLPSKLLGCMRVGVGVGAVMMGGCDAVADAKARVLGEETEVSTPVEVAATPAPAAAEASPAAPEPMLLAREGVAGVVEQARTKAAVDRTAPAPVLPVEDLGRPRTEPEGSPAFVPYDGGSGALAVAPVEPERTTASAKPRTRPQRPKPAPVREWVCGPCGRG